MALGDSDKQSDKNKPAKTNGAVAETPVTSGANTESAVALVVGIGASAGGLEAFRTFFQNTPADTGMAFVLVQHLAPDHNSMLAELVGRTTTMTVTEATDGMPVVANCIYVIPPNATLTISARTLRVERPAPDREHRRPIDTFFESLAKDQGENAVCIILSGTGSDGARSLPLVKEHGGLTIAQVSVNSATGGMSQSAVATGMVDLVLGVDKMSARLVEYQRHLFYTASQKDGDGTRFDTAPQLAKITNLLRAKTGHDFSQYKEKTLARRVQRRMQVLRIDQASVYVAHLKENPSEVELLFGEFLIGVTQFFRDPEAFGVLQATIIPKLLEGKVAGDSLRIWVPACSTGEEVYSIAILIKDELERRGLSLRVQIFGTDIDEAAVALARAGRYRTPMLGVSAERTARWFVEDGEDYCPIKAVREMCVFSTHSVIKDPPFSKLDLISCRNLMIYLDTDLQDRVVRTFHYALRPDGVLFLGSSESLSRNGTLFTALDKKHRIFQRCDAETAFPAISPTAAAVWRATAPTPPSNADQIDRSARRALEKYSPVYVVIDSRHEVLRFSGSEIGNYLGPSAGMASLNLFDILKPPLRSPVRAAVKAVFAAREAISNNDLALRIEGKIRSVTVIAAPLKEGKSGVGMCVVAFQDAGPLATRKDAKPGDKIINANAQAQEQELSTTKAQLQAAIDEFEILTEEMKSANEEYQSVNEELQSSNEELETSKEEMQSVNEELQTINVEMGSKNDLLTRLNSDLKNLFDSTEIATIFLDNELRIKSFTPGMTDIFHLRDADRGRPITEIVTLLKYADLERDVRTVLRKLSIIEHEVQIGKDGATFIMRIRPYRTVDNVIDGAVITFIDISGLRRAEDDRHESELKFRVLADNIATLCWMADGEGSIYWFNRRWYDYTGATLEAHQGWGWQSVHDPEILPAVNERWKKSIATGQPFEMVFPLRGKDGLFRPFLTRIVPMRDAEGRIVIWFGTNTDISAERAIEEALSESQTRLKFALETGQLGEWDLDLANDTSRRSLQYDRTFGYDQPVKDWGMKTFLEHVYPDDRAKVKQHFDEAVARHKTWHFECRVIWPDASIHWISGHGDLYRNGVDPPTHMLGIVCNIDTRKAAERQAQLLLSELDHRVKNILATVSSVVSQTLSSADTPENFAAGLEGRISALSRAHSGLTQNGGGGGALGDIVKTELEAYGDGGHRIKIDGPEVLLTPKASLAFSMAIHELCTNAAKYGALSTATGRLDVAWERLRGSDPAVLRVVWSETSGPTVEPPTRRGFGTTLIERALAYEFDATVERVFLPSGLRCVIELPLTVEVFATPAAKVEPDE